MDQIIRIALVPALILAGYALGFWYRQRGVKDYKLNDYFREDE